MTIVEAGTALVGDDLERVSDPSLVISAGRISAIESAAGRPPASTAPTHRYPGCTILPGLIDAHVHLSLPADGRSYEAISLQPDERLALYGVRNALLHLNAGVTTVRDNGARNQVAFAIRDAIDSGLMPGPRTFAAGRPITSSGGHFAWCNEAADGVDGVTAAVARLIGEGADHIKVMASGGSTLGHDAGLPSYGVAELTAIAVVANRMGRLTTAHARSKIAMDYAVRAGINCIEHADFQVSRRPLGPSRFFGTGPDVEIEYDHEIASRIADSPIFVSMTMPVGGYHTARQIARRRTTEVVSERDLKAEQKAMSKINKRLEVVDRYLKLGMADRLILSSDAGPSVNPFGYPIYGAELGRAAGMTARQVLRSMTLVPARAIGVADHIGTLAVGKLADLVVLEGNPLDDISAVERVRAVYKDGELVSDSTRAMWPWPVAASRNRGT